LFPDVWEHYKLVVKRPMDLRTISENLDAGLYEEPADGSPMMAAGFVEDVRLVFQNAMQYNLVSPPSACSQQPLLLREIAPTHPPTYPAVPKAFVLRLKQGAFGFAGRLRIP
jgi:hypothetical protein